MDLVKTILGAVAPSVSARVAKSVELDPPTAQRLLDAAIPVVLSRILGATRRPEAADSFGKAFRDMGDHPLGALDQALDIDPTRVSETGSGMLGSILGGDELGRIVSGLAKFGGLSKDKSGKLTGFAGAIAMGSVGTVAREQNRDAAGALAMLDAGKDDISASIPPELAGALSESGGQVASDAPEAPDVAPAAPSPSTVSAPEPRRSSLSKWLLLAAAALLLIWLVPRFLGGPDEGPELAVETTAPVSGEAAPETVSAPESEETGSEIGLADVPDAGEAAPEAEAAAPAPEASVPEPEAAAPAPDASAPGPDGAAPETEAAEPEDGQAVPEAAPEAGLDAPAGSTGAMVPEDPATTVPDAQDTLGTIETALAQLGASLGGVDDMASAEDALPQLEEVESTLAEAEDAISALPDDSRASLEEALSASIPTIRETVDRVLADPEARAVLQPVLEDIMERLVTYAG